MHGFGNMYNGGNGIPVGVKMPRHKPIKWFDRVDDYITLSNPALDLSSNFTISAWVFVPVGTYTSMGIVAWGTFNSPSAGQRRSLVLWSGGYPSDILYCYFSGISPANVKGTSNIADSHWHHCAVTLTATSIASVIVDGAIENQGSVILNPYTYSQTHIGQTYYSDSDHEWLYGSIKDARIYNIALTLPQIQDVMVGDIVDQAHLVGRWQLQEREATSALDTSGNGVNGTVYGSPERGLVHVRGAVIRTDPVTKQRYIVR